MKQANLDLSDVDLLDGLCAGEERAFTEVYNRYFGVLYIHAYKILGDDDEAKDAVQDLFSNLWSRRQNLNINSSLSSYLYSAVRYKVLDILEHKKVINKYTDSMKAFLEAGENITDHRIRERELSARIEKEIAALPRKMRVVFELSRKSHYSHFEIARELNITEQTVRTQVNNSLRILRIKLGALFSLVIFLF